MRTAAEVYPRDLRKSRICAQDPSRSLAISAPGDGNAAVYPSANPRPMPPVQVQGHTAF